jgi:DNA repair protein RadC
MSVTYRQKSAKFYLIRDRPKQAPPISRLLEEGPEVLEIKELLNIALDEKEDFGSILSEYGIQFLSSLKSVDEIKEALKINEEKAIRLLAILSIGQRIFSNPFGPLIKIRGIEDVFNHFHSMGYLPQEQLRLLLLNPHYQVVHEEIISSGNSAFLHVTPMQILHHAAARNLNAIILIHNHPSGDSTPSQEDFDFSKQIAKAAKILDIELLDHVIIARESFVSCLKNKPE